MSYQYEWTSHDETLQVIVDFKREDTSFDHAFGVERCHEWVLKPSTMTVFAYVDEFSDWFEITSKLTSKQLTNLAEQVQVSFDTYEASSADESCGQREYDPEDMCE